MKPQTSGDPHVRNPRPEQRAVIKGKRAPRTTRQTRARRALKRDEENWNPVFLKNHADTRNPQQGDVSFKHHPALAMLRRGVESAQYWAHGDHKLLRRHALTPR